MSDWREDEGPFAPINKKVSVDLQITIMAFLFTIVVFVIPMIIFLPK